MSEILYVLKNKNKYEKEDRKKRQEELIKLREEGMFRLAFNDDIEQLRTLFTDPDVKGVTVVVPENMLTKFSTALYFEETKEFNWKQLSYDTYRFTAKEIKL